MKAVLFGNIASGKTTTCSRLEDMIFKCNEVELDDLSILEKEKDILKREKIFYYEFEKKEKDLRYINSSTKLIIIPFLEHFGYYKEAREIESKINYEDYIIIYLKTDPMICYYFYNKRDRIDKNFWKKEDFYNLHKYIDRFFERNKDKFNNYIIIENIDLESRVKIIKTYLENILLKKS
ncbi:hypothetical protein MJ1_0366 [Nanobdella aerobiophila]|uniref:Uncharacterized protein n=1 Tax=Nanobdella aerobiophila TaxID=2586965 RepID=A0A915SY43_9ARCH|nr:hypothetical protein [Nanobdella aerobiophila]BBL45530.1 hypothetical protein MJ1_0366 [Nanobdella aerobiophila]